jgi:hypothetical protein
MRQENFAPGPGFRKGEERTDSVKNAKAAAGSPRHLAKQTQESDYAASLVTKECAAALGSLPTILIAFQS